MKNRFILAGLLTAAAMGACLIPLLAQEPIAQDRTSDEFETLHQDEVAQRERADLFVAAQQSAAQLPSSHADDSAAAPRSLPAAVRQQGAFGRSAFDPALAKAINASNQSVGKLIKELKVAEVDSEKEAIKEKIKKELDIQYDAYLDHHEQPLKQLEERLAKLRKEFDARKQAKADLVKLRLDTIWYDALGLGWPSNRTTTPWRVIGLPGLAPHQNFQVPAYPYSNFASPGAPTAPSLRSPLPAPSTPPGPAVLPPNTSR